MLALVPRVEKRKLLEEEWEGRPHETGIHRWKRLSHEVSVSTKIMTCL